MTKQSTVANVTAAAFIKALTDQRSPAELKKNQRFYEESKGDKCLGVRMGTIFATAKKFSKMQLKEVEKLFASPYYEVRMGAVSIMDFQAREKRSHRKNVKRSINFTSKNINGLTTGAWSIAVRRMSLAVIFPINQEVICISLPHQRMYGNVVRQL